MSDDVEPNIPMLRKAVEWVEWQDTLPIADPNRSWLQSEWGQSPENRQDILEGWEGPSLSRSDYIRTVQMREENRCGTAYCVAGYVTAENGYPVVIDDCTFENVDGSDFVDPEFYAMEVLGIDATQAGALFDSDNTAQKIRRIAEKIAGEKL